MKTAYRHELYLSHLKTSLKSFNNSPIGTYKIFQKPLVRQSKSSTRNNYFKEDTSSKAIKVMEYSQKQGRFSQQRSFKYSRLTKPIAPTFNSREFRSKKQIFNSIGVIEKNC